MPPPHIKTGKKYHAQKGMDKLNLTDAISLFAGRTARNSCPLEVLGTYDPRPRADPYDTSGRLHKDIKLDTARARYWIGVGAQPSDTAWRLLSMVGILPKKSFGPRPNKQLPELETTAVRIR